MKKIFFFLLFTAGISSSYAQTLKDLIKQKTTLFNKSSTNGSANNEIANALKQALTIGAEKGSAALSKPDGFFKNAALKILLPPEAQKIESTLRSVGMGQQVDEAILSINRAAEDACKTAAPIFVSAIKDLTVTDAVNILKGADTAATTYLKTATTTPLTNAFKPIIETSLQKTNATKHWSTLVNAYNKFSFRKLNPSLSDYVTEKALMGIYAQIALEEKNIRQNPAARATDLLKKVFGTN